MAGGFSYFFSVPGLSKLATIIIGLVALVVGVHGHFQSAWIKYDYYKICILDRVYSRFYNDPCPAKEMEEFYVAIVIICFILSIVGFGLSIAILDPYSPIFWIADLVFHFLSSVFLLLAAILFIVSAVQINKHPIIRGDRSSTWLPPHFQVYDVSVFLHTQKIIGGVITIFLAFIYLSVVFSIKRGKNRATNY